MPRPAGVVLALTPSTNPVATVFFKCLLALMTRSVVVVSPHPLAKRVLRRRGSHAGRRRGRGGRAGRRHPGGGRAVGAADRRADDRRAHQRYRRDRRRPRGARRLQLGHARHRRRAGQRARPGGRDRRPGQGGPADRGQQELRQLDPVHERVGADRAEQAATASAAAAEARRRLPARRRTSGTGCAKLLFPGGRFDIRFVGQDASWIAAEAGLRVPQSTRVLLAPFDLVVPEEPLAHEKLCPVLGLVGCRPPGAGSTPRGPCCGCPAGSTRRPSTAPTRR